MIKIKRVYEEPEKNNGCRILVDRLWPRGVSKEKVKVDLWLKEIAPSDKLRRWFSHRDKRWKEFKKRYFSELKEKEELLRKVKERDNVTLVYAAKDEKHNNAVVLKEYVERRYKNDKKSAVNQNA